MDNSVKYLDSEEAAMTGKGALIHRVRARNKRNGVLARRKRNIWRKMRQRRGV